MVRGIAQAVAGGVITAFLIWLAPEIFSFLTKPSVPSGTVIASTQPCTGNWKPFTEGNGRFLVGAGRPPKENLPNFRVYGSTDTFGLPSQGGNHQIVIEKDQLPSHTHLMFSSNDHRHRVDLSHKNSPVFMHDPGGGAEYKIVSDPDNSQPDIGRTSFEGGGAQITVLPPYIALNFCVKE